jgi:hypothetical protein
MIDATYDPSFLLWTNFVAQVFILRVSFMDLAQSLQTQVGKLGHSIPDIRDRAMRSLSSKVMSPLMDDGTLRAFGQSEEFARLVLQWVNDRYDSVDPILLHSCLHMCVSLARQSPLIRSALIEAGGVSFFSEFVEHNPVHRAECESIVRALGNESPPTPDYITQPLPSIPPPDAMFDLSVRVKFATHTTPLEEIQSMCFAIEFGGSDCSSHHLIEALCMQLRCDGPNGSVDDFAAESFGHCLLRLLARGVPSGVLVSLMRTALAIPGTRPGQVHYSARIFEFIDFSSVPEDCADSVIQTVLRTVNGVFPESAYSMKKVVFADHTSTVLRTVSVWTPSRLILSRLVSRTMEWLKDHLDFLGRHAVVMHELRCHFDAWQTTTSSLCLSMKKLKSKDILADQNLFDLYVISKKLPSLLPDISRKFFIQRMEPRLLSYVMSIDEEIATEFFRMFGQFDVGRFSRKTLVNFFAFSSGGDVFAFTDRIREGGTCDLLHFGGQTPKEECFWDLFQTDDVRRKQASLALWKMYVSDANTECSFVSDPIRAVVNTEMGFVDDSVVDGPNVISTISNERLDSSVRTAACAQVSVKNLSSETIEAIWGVMTTGTADELFVGICRVLAQAVLHFPISNSQWLSEETKVQLIVRNVFSYSTTRSRAAIVLLSRIVFMRGQQLEDPTYLAPVLRRLKSRFHILETDVDCEKLFGTAPPPSCPCVIPSDQELARLVGSQPDRPPPPSEWKTVLAIEQYKLAHEESEIDHRLIASMVGSRIPPAGAPSQVYLRYCHSELFPASRIRCQFLDELERCFLTPVPAWFLCEVVEIVAGMLRQGGEGDERWRSVLARLTAVASTDTLITCVMRLALVIGKPYPEELIRIASDSCVRLDTSLFLLLDDRAEVGGYVVTKLAQQLLTGISVHRRVMIWRLCRFSPDLVELAIREIQNEDDDEVSRELCLYVAHHVGLYDRDHLLAMIIELVKSKPGTVRSLALVLAKLSPGPALIANDLWEPLLRHVGGVEIAQLVLACTRVDPTDRFLDFLVQSGVVDTVAAAIAQDRPEDDQVIEELLEYVSRSSHWPREELVKAWSVLVVWPHVTGRLKLLEILGWILVGAEVDVGVDMGPVADMLVSQFSTPAGCRAITSVVRVGALQTGKKFLNELISLMHLHNTVVVSDTPIISALFGSQIRMICATVASVIRADHQTGTRVSLVLSELSDWFVGVWKRAAGIREGKQTSGVPVMSELACGLVEICSACRDGDTIQLLSSPLSEVLSLATRKDFDMVYSSDFFALLLSVGESACEGLRRKAITGRILGALIALHASVLKSVARGNNFASAVARFACTLGGCHFAAEEIAIVLDEWIMGIDETTKLVDDDILVRIIGGLVLAEPRFRNMILSNSRAMELVEQDEPLGRLVLDVIKPPRSGVSGE